MAQILDTLLDQSTVAQTELEWRHSFCKHAIELLSLTQEELNAAGQELGLSKGCSSTELLQALLVQRYSALRVLP